MSVILRDLSNGELLLLSKGADEVMLARVEENPHHEKKKDEISTILY